MTCLLRIKNSRILLVIVALLAWSAVAHNAIAIGQTQRAPQPTCAPNIDACPAEGCSSDNHHDPKLNRLKNIKTLSASVHDRTLVWIKTHADPKQYQRGGDRKELTKLKEGQRTRVVGYLLRAKLELGGESCNCYLRTEETTDNHLVLVTKDTVDRFQLPANPTKAILDSTFHSREAESITAEFTPRVRKLSHPHFTSESIQPLIDGAPQQALLVRVTGQLMFDSEHFFQNRLNRITNWEVHPIFRLEYCPTGKKCTRKGKANWVDLDQ
jgi:hypothetical protein